MCDSFGTKTKKEKQKAKKSMAIYHASAKIVRRSEGRSSTAAAAYRSGSKITDERTGEIHDYSRKRDVGFKEILAPKDSPEWAQSRDKLWNNVEASERRGDAQVAREFEVAIPVELSKEERRDLVRNFANDNFVSEGMIADICHHDENGNNPHAHILLTMRDVNKEGFQNKNRSWNSREKLKDWRVSWEKKANKALTSSGHSEQIDHRSLQDQGLDREPQIHHANRPIRIDRNKGIIRRNIERIKNQIEKIKEKLQSKHIEEDSHDGSISRDYELSRGSDRRSEQVENIREKLDREELSQPQPSREEARTDQGQNTQLRPIRT